MPFGLSAGVVFLAVGAVFVVVAIGIVAGILLLLNPRRTARDRLEDLTGGPKEVNDPMAEAIAARLSTLAQPKDEEQRDLLKLKLIQAGYRDRRAVEYFNGIRVALAITLPVVISPLLVALNNWLYMGIGVIGVAGFGYMVPYLIVSNALQKRQKTLLLPFPDALDLLVTSVEAGLGVDAAFRRVADELHAAAPDLALEFQLVNHEISAGVARVDALRHLAERTGLEEVKSLVNMLAQAERFGTSIARSLRVHSELTRAKRMARAEEEAAKVSPKLTVVMILFLLPCLMVVLLGPAIIRVKNQFSAN